MFKRIKKWLHERKATNFLNQFEEIISLTNAYSIDYFGGPEKLLQFNVRVASTELVENPELDCRLTIIGKLSIVDRVPVSCTYNPILGMVCNHRYDVSIDDLSPTAMLRVAKILRNWESRKVDGNIILDVPVEDTFEPIYLKGLRNVNNKMCTYTIIEK